MGKLHDEITPELADWLGQQRVFFVATAPLAADGIHPPRRQAPRLVAGLRPTAADGRGRVVVTLDGKSVSVDLGVGDRKTRARFDRFGLLTTWIDGNAQQVYFDEQTDTCGQ